MQTDLSSLSLTALKNLLLEEMRAFIAALEVESSDQLQERKEWIKAIDRELEKRRSGSSLMLLV